MDNLKRPAEPQPMIMDGDGQILNSWQHHEDFAGFTKLEKAALIIAAGMMGGAWSDGVSEQQLTHIQEESVRVARGVIQEANK